MSDRAPFTDGPSDDELDELLGAYALDALDRDEREAVDGYLERSPRARAEVREHREVASMLAWSGSTAPDGLWDRIASSIDGQAPPPSGKLAQVLSMDDGRRRPRRAQVARSIGAWAAAAAAVAAIAVVAVRAGDDPTTPSEALQQQVDDAFHDPAASVVTLSAPGGPMVRAVIEPDGRGYLVGDALPRLGEDRTYQLWGTVAGERISLGLLGSTPAVESFRAGDDVSELAVTVERAGGVVESSNPPVVVSHVD